MTLSCPSCQGPWFLLSLSLPVPSTPFISASRNLIQVKSYFTFTDRQPRLARGCLPPGKVLALAAVLWLPSPPQPIVPALALSATADHPVTAKSKIFARADRAMGQAIPYGHGGVPTACTTGWGAAVVSLGATLSLHRALFPPLAAKIVCCRELGGAARQPSDPRGAAGHRRALWSRDGWRVTASSAPLTCWCRRAELLFSLLCSI